MNNIVVSFFKQYGIPYIINKDKKSIKYICFLCHTEAQISAIRTYWKCNGCGEDGTLVHLIKFLNDTDTEFIEELKNSNIYDEAKEINEINKLLSQLGDTSTVKTIQQKLNRVFEQQKRQIP